MPTKPDKKGTKKLNKIGLLGNYKLAKHKNLILEIHNYLLKKNKTVILDENVAEAIGSKEGKSKEKIMKEVDLAIILGGDGTLLRAAQALSKKVVYIYGINFGTLGFLSESSKEKAMSGLKRIFANKYVVDKRFLLRATIYRNGLKLRSNLALNDIVINQGIKARLIKLRVDMNQRKVTTYEADGLIVSTPTGSTGHSLSAGGPIVHPKLESFILSPICPVSLSHRPIIIPNDRQINVTVETPRSEQEAISMTVDGQETFSLEYGDEVKIRKSSRYFYIVRMTGENYYKALRTKLGWGE